MGAPTLYNLKQKKAIKKIENDYNYSVKREALVNEVKKTNAQIKDDFIKALCTLCVCDFNYFITLTFDPKSIKKSNLLKQLHNDEIRGLLGSFPEMERYLISSNPYRQNIEFVKNVGTAYFNYLFSKHHISNALTSIEKDTRGRWHIHALITSDNINIEYEVSQRWFYGRTKTEKIGAGEFDNGNTMEQHRKKIIEYMYETFNPTSTSHIQQKRLDYWHLFNYKSSVNPVEVSLTDEDIKKEINFLNNRLSNAVQSDDYSSQRGSVSDFLVNWGHVAIESLSLSPMALFYLITIILILT
jgi:hypothetical protein